MIHVNAQPEPASFHKNVRQKGLNWLRKKGIPLDRPLPPKTEPYPYWRNCLDDLHESYKRCCAYLAIYIEPVTGSRSVDHFIPKSQRPDLIYEWSNYRLACIPVNSCKSTYPDVLDPFEVEDGWFRLELLTGHIYPSPDLPEELREKVVATIEHLKLDAPGNQAIRAEHFDFYKSHKEKGDTSEDYLRDYLSVKSPFVWSEIQRREIL